MIGVATSEAVARRDVRERLDELLYLARDGWRRTGAAIRQLEPAAAQVDMAESSVLAQLRACHAGYGEVARRLLALGEGALNPDADVDVLEREREAIGEHLRSQQLVTAALITARDWQSPSFAHSARPAAGRHAGFIKAGWNDYKRDRHLDADAYEASFERAFVDAPDLRALLTSCGMAAFTTILALMHDERRLSSHVLMGRGVYHECRQLLERGLGRVDVVDESDTRAMLATIKRTRPRALFLDSLSNTAWAPLPDIQAVIACLAQRPYGETCLVIDNTGLSLGLRPFSLTAAARVRMIVFESLLKYVQLGLDRTNAGIVVARADDAAQLNKWREHLGTNASDVAALSLPTPDRWLLTRRLTRLQRNARVIAARLASAGAPAVDAVVHASLPNHPACQRARALGFCGGCVNIVLTPGTSLRRRQEHVIERALKEARDVGRPLVAGSSFGFDVTRIYLTAGTTGYGEPFIRVAAGTEPVHHVEALADAIARAMISAAPPHRRRSRSVSR
jgi:cystathionine beta-lyase/cystathionine gamma-synthase